MRPGSDCRGRQREAGSGTQERGLVGEECSRGPFERTSSEGWACEGRDAESGEDRGAGLAAWVLQAARLAAAGSRARARASDAAADSQATGVGSRQHLFGDCCNAILDLDARRTPTAPGPLGSSMHGVVLGARCESVPGVPGTGVHELIQGSRVLDSFRHASRASETATTRAAVCPVALTPQEQPMHHSQRPPRTPPVTARLRHPTATTPHRRRKAQLQHAVPTTSRCFTKQYRLSRQLVTSTSHLFVAVAPGTLAPHGAARHPGTSPLGV
ncbi:uncharacterized protein BDZ99DRAFT_557175 [Mytilinidion resinicola]|uniref:Uncharacterized protein n=1 Tax=Mytilinidion resinicola TaxID=574789 RepID=A0A6A6YXE6_9PEZI|nr:uncharacterized protein BDZ99DRAFT_557175 [Mytilinidion resinicola]KAF2813460.1 hypothetical protein BDZ99DRAFT_557175 [Mytilinidion resinicola]